MAKIVYRLVGTNEEAVRLGFPNVQSYRLALRQEQAREARAAYADTVSRYQQAMAQKLQQGTGHIMRTSPLTTMQAEAARARKAEQGGRR
jgi:hypothetical protein